MAGPTAVGKTGLSLKLAQDKFDIISADSVQIYKYMNIGSGKPGLAERKKVKHYLIDLVEPDFPFSAGDYCREAKKASDDVRSSGKLPLFVGGTGLYIDAFFRGISDIPDVDIAIREDLRSELKARGLAYLYSELLIVDSDFGEKIHPNDSQRIMRGLEVYRGTGKAISSFYNPDKEREGFDNSLYLGLYEEREKLRNRIDQRVNMMIEAGLVDEVDSLRKRGYSPELKSMKSIGYFEINNYLAGEIDFQEAVEKMKIATKRYAKRQMTWFRKNKMIDWFKPDEFDKITEVLNHWVEGILE